MLNLLRPEWFVPVHGEYRHMVHHADLAEASGVDPEQDLSSARTATRSRSTTTGSRSSGARFRPATSTSTGSSATSATGVLRDRRQLAEEGVVVVIVTVDQRTGEIVTGPEIVTKGWVYAPEAEELLEEAKAAVREALAAAAAEGRHRLRDHPPPRPPRARSLHQRTHQAAPGRHPRRHGGLT